MRENPNKKKKKKIHKPTKKKVKKKGEWKVSRAVCDPKGEFICVKGLGRRLSGWTICCARVRTRVHIPHPDKQVGQHGYMLGM